MEPINRPTLFSSKDLPAFLVCWLFFFALSYVSFADAIPKTRGEFAGLCVCFSMVTAIVTMAGVFLHHRSARRQKDFNRLWREMESHDVARKAAEFDLKETSRLLGFYRNQYTLSLPTIRRDQCIGDHSLSARS